MPSDQSDVPRYTAIFQIDFTAESEVHSIIASESIRAVIVEEIEEEDGDTVELLELTPVDGGVSPVTDIRTLRSARNILLRTRNKEAYDIARELDKFAWILEYRTINTDQAELVNYDWGSFMTVLTEVMSGLNPMDH